MLTHLEVKVMDLEIFLLKFKVKVFKKAVSPELLYGTA